MVLEAFSISHGKASAYLPVLELLSAYFEINRDDDERKRRERILGKVLGLDRNLEDAVPYLYSLHAIAEAGDSLAQVEPQARRRRTLEAIKRILLRESLNQPLMLMFEDLHWIDSETQALNLLVDAIANARILLLVNYRPEYRHEWGSRTHYTQLRLDPLGRDSAEEMLDALLPSPAKERANGPEGNARDLTPLKRLIIERTEGTPFFMEEMVQALFEEGVLQRNGTVKLAKPMSTIKVPATVQAVLASRIDRLASAEKELLQTLAVLGREFTLTLVQQVTLKSKDELEKMLSQLQAGEFINEQPAVGEDEYHFKHTLTQEVAYGSVLIERRKALHERAGEAIETLFPDRLDDYVIDLAHHYDRSSNQHKAIDYLGRAALRAAEQSAHAEVSGYVTRGLELINRLQDGTERARRELELQITLSISLLAVGPGSSERDQALARALELCEQLGDTRIIEVMLSLGLVRWSRRESLLAMQLFEKALALAEQAKDADLLVAAHAAIAYQLMILGQFENARAHFETAIELSGGRPIRKFGQSLVTVQTASIALGLALLALGYPVTALEKSKKGLESARQRSEPYVNAGALGVYLTINVGLRDIRSVAQQVEELAAITDEHEIPVYQAIAKFCRGLLMADAGRVNEGLSDMAPVISQFGVLPPADWLVVAMAEVYVRNAQSDEGLAAIRQALTRSEQAPWLQAEFYRLQGELTLLKDPNSEAEAESYLHQAIEIARCQAARLFELRATTSLARLLT